ncbi:MAG TPA: iron-containing redox enzyme family protein [Streptosporangiaceae bacterium]|nr:iron-containing redox enzyme family protein [Streptosporangiaceae bacterium]
MTEAYITGVGAYLPGDPIDNEQLADRFGDGTARDAVLRRRALAANGIRTRHYAVDGDGLTVMLNEELAAHAAERALADRGLPATAVGMLATGTTQGDVLVPGFASMVHGRLGGGPMELLSAAGVCASGMAALKGAVSAVRLGDHPVAVAVGSELVSRSFGIAPADTLDTNFLRWTLSDGAGAVVVEPRPRPDGLSLRVDWMHLVSHAHKHPVCMSAGLGEDRTPAAGETWLDRRPGCAVEVPRLRQDMSALPDLVDVGIAEFCSLVRAGRIDPGTEHILCHYSAEHFRGKLFARLADAGYPADERHWFTNLHTAGNTGAASIFVMLAEARTRMRPGDRVLLIVPESGRFTLAFAHLTCVGSTSGPSPAELAASPLGAPVPGDAPAVSRAFIELAGVWSELEHALGRVPVVRRIEDGTSTLDDYQRLLVNLRQQVVDGGRWISLAASNFSTELFWLRSAAIQHAAAEHRDFLMLERDFAAVGGDQQLMTGTPANIGSAALSSYVFHRAGQPDPVDLLGAMFVIEGLGVRKAARWADCLQQNLGLSDDQVSFLRYHAAGDDEHFGVLRASLRSGLFDDAAITRIVKTARVVARLYALQLEELDHV